MKPIENVLVTGGAGFIGSYTTEMLLDRGYGVTVLDNLDPQVHDSQSKVIDRIKSEAKFVVGDVRDRRLLSELIAEVDAIIHLAASVGVGQSMYAIRSYVDVNTAGTACLLDILAETSKVRKLVVASSFSVYGEGSYICSVCSNTEYPDLRLETDLARGVFEHRCTRCGARLVPTPTDESKPLNPTSIYAMTKRHQEEMCLLIGRTYGIPTVALRYFNVYGPRQSLSNPYTGVCSIFLSRILNHNPPFVFEDGDQTRDLIHIKDVARANVLALEKDAANYKALNVGTGRPTSILEIATKLCRLTNAPFPPQVVGIARKGDIRHCYASTTEAERYIGFKAEIDLGRGLPELVHWIKQNDVGAIDLFQKAHDELVKRKLA